jgi:hypothetical protein
MENQKHNGWTNYATWRVNLEMFDGYDPDGEPVCSYMLQDMAEETIACNAKGLARDYAMAFLADVNWNEIAVSINEAYELKEV